MSRIRTDYSLWMHFKLGQGLSLNVVVYKTSPLALQQLSVCLVTQAKQRIMATIKVGESMTKITTIRRSNAKTPPNSEARVSIMWVMVILIQGKVFLMWWTLLAMSVQRIKFWMHWSPMLKSKTKKGTNKGDTVAHKGNTYVESQTIYCKNLN